MDDTVLTQEEIEALLRKSEQELPKTPDLPSSAQGLPSTSDDGMLAEQPRLIVSMSLRGVTEKTTLALPPSS